jgi:hypothetical protein
VGFWTVVWVSFSVIIDNIPLKPLLAHGKTYPVDYNIVYYVMG